MHSAYALRDVGKGKLLTLFFLVDSNKLRTSTKKLYLGISKEWLIFVTQVTALHVFSFQVTATKIVKKNETTKKREKMWAHKQERAIVPSDMGFPHLFQLIIPFSYFERDWNPYPFRITIPPHRAFFRFFSVFPAMLPPRCFPRNAYPPRCYPNDDTHWPHGVFLVFLGCAA